MNFIIKQQNCTSTYITRYIRIYVFIYIDINRYMYTHEYMWTHLHTHALGKHFTKWQGEQEMIWGWQEGHGKKLTLTHGYKIRSLYFQSLY